MPASREPAGPLFQSQLFPPPDPSIWTEGRSCDSIEKRQALLDHIGAEIRWRSSQLHRLKRTAKGRILDCCDYFDGRKFTLQELKRRWTKLNGLLERRNEFEAALGGATRRESRRRKSAPLHLRLAAYLDPIARAGEGGWKPCPTYDKLAEALGVCLESISQAFKRLEQDPECQLAFVCAYSGPKRCRQKHVALKAWLKYDGLPLHFEKKGRHRKLRPTFRKGVERITPPPLIAARYGSKSKPPGHTATGPSHSRFGTGNSRNCLSHSIRLTPAVLKDNPRQPAKHVSRPHKPHPRGAVVSKSLENAAWRAAREAKSDGELFWDNSKVKIPLPTLKTLILEAFRQGYEWNKHVRPALLFGIKEAHAAACLGNVRNPGAFAASIFREKRASMRPDLDHLAQVIEHRRVVTSVPKSGDPRVNGRSSDTHPGQAVPLPRFDPADPKIQAGARAMDRLAAYIGEQMESLKVLSPEESEAIVAQKYEELVEEEIKLQNYKNT